MSATPCEISASVASGYASNFQYGTLPNPSSYIRLLQITKSNKSGLFCTLTTHNIWDRLNYCAISYVWGSSERSEAIFVNGRRFLITKSCRQALEQVRHYHRSGLVWIDMICINQRSVLEKNEQVGIMGSIYSRARCVTSVLSGFVNIDRRGELLARIASEIGQGGSLSTFAKGKPLGPDTGHADCTKLAELLWLDISLNPYWTRAWIRQEVLLGWNLTILYDAHAILWSDLLAFMRFMRGDVTRRNGLGNGGFANVSALLKHYSHYFNDTGLRRIFVHAADESSIVHFELGRNLLRNKSEYKLPLQRWNLPPIEDYLTSKKLGFECRERRDTIYSLLSIMAKPDWCRERIIPDYAKSAYTIACEALDYFGTALTEPVLPFYQQQSILPSAMALLEALQIKWNDADIVNLVQQRRMASESRNTANVQASTCRVLSEEQSDLTSALPATLFGVGGFTGRPLSKLQLNGLLREQTVHCCNIEWARRNSAGRIVCRLARSCDTELSSLEAEQSEIDAVLEVDVQPYPAVLRSADNDIVCLLSCSLQDGDCLVQTHGSDFPTCLILRRYNDRVFEIIGQAIMARNVTCTSKILGEDYRSGTEQIDDMWLWGVKLYLSKDDLFAYLAQDLELVDASTSVQPSNNRSVIDREPMSSLQLQRLRTSVTGSRWSSYALRDPANCSRPLYDYGHRFYRDDLD